MLIRSFNKLKSLAVRRSSVDAGLRLSIVFFFYFLCVENICASVYAGERSPVSFALVFMRLCERENN